MLRKAQTLSGGQALSSAFQPLDVAAAPIFTSAGGSGSGGAVSSSSFVVATVGGGMVRNFIPSDMVAGEGEQQQQEEVSPGINFSLVTSQQQQQAVVAAVAGEGLACIASTLQTPADIGAGPWNLVKSVYSGGSDGRSFFVLSNTGTSSLDVVEVVDLSSSSDGIEDEGDTVVPAAGSPASVSLKVCGSVPLEAAPGAKVSALATSSSGGVVVGFSDGTVAYAAFLNNQRSSSSSGDRLAQLELVHKPTPIPGFAKSQVSCATLLKGAAGGGGKVIALVACGPIVAPIDCGLDVSRISVLKSSSSATSLSTAADSTSGDPQYQPLKVKSSSVWQERVTAMDEDGTGNIVIGTASGGLFVFDLRNPRTPTGHLPSTGSSGGEAITTATTGRVSGVEFGSSPQNFVTTTAAGEVRQWSVADQVSAATTFPYKSILLQSPENGNGVLALTSLPVPEFNQEGFLLSDEGGSAELYF